MFRIRATLTAICLAFGLAGTARADTLRFDTYTQGLGAPGTAALPVAIETGSDGALWFDALTQDSGGGQSVAVGRLAPGASEVQELPVPNGAAPPSGIALAGTQLASLGGKLYFLEVTEDAGQTLAAQRLVSIDPRTTPSTIASTALPTTDPACPGEPVRATGALVTGGDGALWLLAVCGNPADHALIGRLSPGGAPSWFPIAGATEAGRTIARAADGTLWFTTRTGGKFAVAAAATSATPVVTPYTAGLPPAARVDLATIAPGSGATVSLTVHDPASQTGSSSGDAVISIQTEGVGRGTAVAHKLGSLQLVAPSVLGAPDTVVGPDGETWLLAFDPSTPSAAGRVAEIAPDGTLRVLASIPAPLIYGWAPVFAPDGHLWLGGLVEAASGTGGALVRVTLPPASGGGTPPSTVPPTAPRPSGSQLALSCSHARLALLDVVAHRHRVLLRGAADARLVGQRVTIRLDDRRSVATATVGADGFFTATAPLPARRLRLAARYRASAGGVRSAALKLTRRLVLEPPTAQGGEVILTGTVRPPLSRPVARIEVRQQTSCGQSVVVERAKVSRSGRFRITVPAPAGAAAAIYRLATSVRKTARDHRRYPTFSLPQPIDLG